MTTAKVRVVSDRAYVVSPQLVAAFADAVGETDPLCHDERAARVAGFPDVVAPPGFCYPMTYRVGIELLEAAGIDPNRITHVGEAHQLMRPITAGDVLIRTAAVTGSRELFAGHTVLTWQVEIVDSAGRVVGKTTSSVLVREDERLPVPREPATFSPPPGATVHRFAITRGNIARFCGVTGDAHPLHWSDVVARRCGLNQVIAHGGLLLAMVGRAATLLAGGVAGVTEVGARFAVPVQVPDDDTGCVLEVAAAPASPGGRRALEVGAGGHRVLSSAFTVINSG